jgi:Rieske Fe-S protein
MVQSDQPGSGCCCCASEEPRRSFLTRSLAVLIGAAAFATPVFAGIASFFSPILGKKEGGGGNKLKLSSLEMLPADGTPVKVPVVMDRVDAWNTFRNEPVGAVFLQRSGTSVTALQVVCPHAGCFIEYSAEKKLFVCPCHLATFNLDGSRTPGKSESPRDLDPLEVEVKGSEVWVTFQKFQEGTTERKPMA